MFNVLIVDDDSMVAELNRLFISRVADFRCCGIASTLAEAEQMLNHLPPIERAGSAAHPAYERPQHRCDHDYFRRRCGNRPDGNALWRG